MKFQGTNKILLDWGVPHTRFEIFLSLYDGSTVGGGLNSDVLLSNSGILLGHFDGLSSGV